MEDDLDFSKLVSCPHCRKPIPQDATICLYCGESVYIQNNNKSWIVALVIALIIILILTFIL